MFMETQFCNLRLTVLFTIQTKNNLANLAEGGEGHSLINLSFRKALPWVKRIHSFVIVYFMELHLKRRLFFVCC